MGLNLIPSAWIPSVPMGRISQETGCYWMLQHALRHAGLSAYSIPMNGRNYQPKTEFGRAYHLRSLGESSRAELLPYNHMRRLTCSEYQCVLPIVFDNPIPAFPDLPPDAFGLEVMTREACERNYGCSWDYTYTTPAEEVFHVSAPRLVEECELLLDQTLPEWRDVEVYRRCGLQRVYEAFWLREQCREVIEVGLCLHFDG